MGRNLGRILAITALGLGAAGCTTTFETNLISGLREQSFSDKEFNAVRSGVALPTGDYCFGAIHPSDIVTINGEQVELSELFPFFAIREDEMTEHIFPGEEEVLYGRDDGQVRLFRLDDNIDYLRTNRGFKRHELHKGRRVANLSESSFYVPAIDFNVPELGEVPYSGSPRGNILVGGASYRLNHRTGLIEMFGDMYVETLGTVESRRRGMAPEDFVEAEIVEKQVSE